MNDEQQLKDLLTAAAELPGEVAPPVASLLHRGRRRRARRTGLVAATAAVAVLAAAGVPATIHALRAPPYRPGSTGTGLLGPLPAQGGPAAAQIAGFRWSRLPASPLGPREDPLLAWTGRELIELGGLHKGGTTEDGAAFDPATGRWHRIASVGSRNIGFVNGVSVWTGRQLFVSNGQNESCLPPKGSGGGTPANCFPHAGLYDPATNRWTQTRLPNAMSGLELMAAVWTGRDVILAGVNTNLGRLGVAAYDPATGRWQMITPVLPAGHPARAVAMTATTSRLILWSLWDRVHGSGLSSGIDVLAAGSDGAWRDVTGGWPQHVTITSPQFTGTQILVPPGQVWCGDACSPPYASFAGYFADPVTLARTTIPKGPLGSLGPAFIWTGRAVIGVNESTSSGTGSSSGGSHTTLSPGISALFNPATRRWQSLPKPPGYPNLSAVLPAWAGNELLMLTARGHLLALHG
jgi:hypothetical protein